MNLLAHEGLQFIWCLEVGNSNFDSSIGSSSFFGIVRDNGSAFSVAYIAKAITADASVD